MIGSVRPTPQQRDAAALVVAMLKALVRDDLETSADVNRLIEDMWEVIEPGNEAVGLILQTCGSIIAQICKEVEVDPLGVLQAFLGYVRAGPTTED